ncbi:MAG: hypothetical protein PHC85_00250 [Candidatus Pacebacteria bacterium]|nr:hypothetical protein [Candidatus Paceibacterota bacterium]
MKRQSSTSFGMWLSLVGVFAVLACLSFAQGCTTLLTEKGREERDLNLNYKKVFVADAGMKAYFNCRKAGGSKEFCEVRYGVYDDGEGGFLPDAEGSYKSTYSPVSGGSVNSVNHVSSRADIPPVEKRHYLNIGGDPVNRYRKLGADETLSSLPYDTEVVLEGRNRNSTGWIRGGTPAVYGPDGKLRWIKACGNDVLKILRDARPLSEQTPVVATKREDESKTVYNPPFQFLPMPNLGMAYLDAPRGTWQGNLWEMVPRTYLGASANWVFGLPDTNFNTSVNTQTGVGVSATGSGAGAGGGTTTSAPTTTTNTTSSSNSGYSSSNTSTYYYQSLPGQTSVVAGGGPVGGAPGNAGSGAGAPIGGAPTVIVTTPSSGVAIGAGGAGGGFGGTGVGGPVGGNAP